MDTSVIVAIITNIIFINLPSMAFGISAIICASLFWGNPCHYHQLPFHVWLLVLGLVHTVLIPCTCAIYCVSLILVRKNVPLSLCLMCLAAVLTLFYGISAIPLLILGTLTDGLDCSDVNTVFISVHALVVCWIMPAALFFLLMYVRICDNISYH